ncbi:MAG: hypothetical protein KatS3mg057_0260 [Herpetosiphonaceae bacterium]|nr:MAG: hypothetical protein KatS3mg057_0260 [Herpetosiphonaceae bacterium]
MRQAKTAVVDGANIAYIEKTREGKPKVSNLVAVCRAIEEKGLDPIVIVDAGLRYEVDDPDQLEALIDQQRVRQAPAGTDADFFVLQIAEEEQGLVISNDLFEDYRDRFPWIEERRVPVMIVQGEAHLYLPSLKQERG